MAQRNSITSLTSDLTISQEFKPASPPSEEVDRMLSEDDEQEYDDETHPNMKLPPGGKYALIVLTGINLLNYIDRYVPSATKDLFKADLHLSDTETSAPLTAFLIIYIISAPIFGSLCDRGFSRKVLMCIGVIIWSISTAAAFFANDFWSFLICRTIVGVGESAYGTIAPALLSDFYPKSKRNKVLTIFYIAIPVGAALGYGIGGLIGGSLGWRYAFLICGLPGVVFAFLCLKIQDPGRGIWEKSEKAKQTISWKKTLISLMKNRSYVTAVAGYTAVTFAAGGMADWLPTYMHRENGADIDSAGLIVGAATVVGGLGGTISGGYIAERLKTKTRLPYIAVSGVSLVPATVLAFIMLYAVHSMWGVAALLLFCQLFLWCYSGPINTTLANSVPVSIRARGFSLSILTTHLLGDAISPLIIGAISDSTGSLKSAVVLVPIAIGISCIVWLCGWRLLPEVERTKEATEDLIMM